MNTLLKYTIAVFAFGMFAATAFAGSVNESPSVETFLVTNGFTKDDWGTTTSIGDGDKLAVQLHYYLQEGDSTSNMRFRIEDLAGRTYSDGDQEDVWAEISANGLTSKQGSRTVQFTDDVRLEFHGVTWQIYPCQSTSCEEQLPSDYRNITSSGMNIGAVEGWTDGNWQGKHYAGNVIVEFKAYKVQPNYQDCTLDGVTVAHGDSHRFYSQETTTGQCSAYDQVRTCNDGVLSGSSAYQYASCTTVSISPAEVDTLSATNISTHSAQLRGDLDLDDWNDADVYFRWGTSSSNLNNTTADYDANNSGIFTRTLYGLQDNTRYYFQAVAEDDDGDKVYGDIEYFTTSEETYENCYLDGVTVQHGDSYRFYSQETTYGQCGAYDQVRTCNDGVLSGSDSYKYASCTAVSITDAVVDTLSATNVDTDSARLRGDLDLNDWNDADVYFRWGYSSGNLSNKTPDQDKNNSGIFSRTITGLHDDTTYYYQAVARDDNGAIEYGSVKGFRTDEDNNHSGTDSDITTLSAIYIDDDSARLRGEWKGDNHIDVWFAFDEHDETPSCNLSSQRVGRTTVDDNDDFAETVTGLDENERYYFRACAEDSDGDTLSGSIRNFTTDEDDDDDHNNDEIDITTWSATNVSEDSARLRGEMEGDNHIDVWFAFDEHDETPSCNLSSQRVGSTTVDDNDDFAETMTGLDANEKYYFRACGEDTDGDVVSGSIRSFITDEDEDDDDSDDRDEQVALNAVTNIASGITTNAARFNAYVFGEGDARCFFQYGQSASLGLSTGGAQVDLDSDTTCSFYRTNLSSNTTYYYRVVLVQDGAYEYGSIQSFRTDRVSAPVVPNNPNPPTQEEEEEDEGTIEVTKWVSAETDPRFDTFTRAQGGETVYYKVRVENNTNEDIDNLEVIDRIPFYLEIDTDRASDDDEDNKTVQWSIDLDEGESRTFITEMRVREDARRGDIIVSYASAEATDYSANSNDVEIEIESGDFLNNEDQNDSDQRAFLFAAGIFPDTLVGWCLLILILLAILYMISRIIVARNEHARAIAELEAARRGNSGGAA